MEDKKKHKHGPKYDKAPYDKRPTINPKKIIKKNKKFIIGIATIILIGASYFAYKSFMPKNGTYTYSLNDSKIEENYVWGKLEGLQKEWYNSGIIKSEKNYTNGKLNGRSIEYYSTGVLNYEKNYTNGKLNGRVIEYYSTGVLNYEKNYTNGKLNGRVIEYYSTGVLKYEGQFINGKIFSPSVFNKNNGENLIADLGSVKILALESGYEISINNVPKIFITNIILDNEVMHQTALAAARDSRIDGYSDWRLPDTSELAFFIILIEIFDFSPKSEIWTNEPYPNYPAFHYTILPYIQKIKDSDDKKFIHLVRDL